MRRYSDLGLARPWDALCESTIFDADPEILPTQPGGETFRQRGFADAHLITAPGETKRRQPSFPLLRRTTTRGREGLAGGGYSSGTPARRTPSQCACVVRGRSDCRSTRRRESVKW